MGGNGLVGVIGRPRLVATTRAAMRPFKSACRLLWRDGSRLEGRQHVWSQQRTFPPQEGYNRTRKEKGWRGGKDNSNVLKFNIGVVNGQDNVDGLILVIVAITIDQRTGGMR